ncbi:voltage-gated hydrogen channel 1-like [Tubulanus polymorphus]|uniref:voltage-gated hydrogen channel 1-like n=1 Tax=Tubulanus polymorphus TaxID=672921 RepID=UPI003DA6415D
MGMDGFKKLSDDLERVIEKEETSSSVTSDSDETKEPVTCRSKLQHVLHTNKFQIGVVVLVIIDCLLVIGELLIELEVFALNGHSDVPHVLHYMSIAILSIFMIELLVKVYAFRLEFFKQKLEVFDGIIVIVSFVLDIVFIKKEGITEAIGLIILLRLWRVARILNGIIMSVKVQADKKIHKERRIREAVEQELNKYREYCTAQEKEIEVLQALLKKHKIEFEKTNKPVVPVRKIDVIAEVTPYSGNLNEADV